jgi:DNA-directed RNA polymerase specialized sigma24 family protein
LLNLSRWRVQDQLRRRNSPDAPRRARSPADDTARTATIDRMADPAGVELEAIWDQEWQATLLAAALEKVKAQVDAKQWQMFDLYALKEWTPREVARVMEVSVGQV